MRRQLAGRLVEIGDSDGAIQRLRVAHEAFARLAPECELSQARERLSELGVRPRRGRPHLAAQA